MLIYIYVLFFSLYFCGTCPAGINLFFFYFCASVIGDVCFCKNFPRKFCFNFYVRIYIYITDIYIYVIDYIFLYIFLIYIYIYICTFEYIYTVHFYVQIYIYNFYVRWEKLSNGNNDTHSASYWWHSKLTHFIRYLTRIARAFLVKYPRWNVSTYWGSNDSLKSVVAVVEFFLMLAGVLNYKIFLFLSCKFSEVQCLNFLMFNVRIF